MVWYDTLSSEAVRFVASLALNRACANMAAYRSNVLSSNKVTQRERENKINGNESNKDVIIPVIALQSSQMLHKQTNSLNQSFTYKLNVIDELTAAFIISNSASGALIPVLLLQLLDEDEKDDEIGVVDSVFK
jgi:hypothetical protein